MSHAFIFSLFKSYIWQHLSPASCCLVNDGGGLSFQHECSPPIHLLPGSSNHAIFQCISKHLHTVHAKTKHSILCGPSQYFQFYTYNSSCLQRQFSTLKASVFLWKEVLWMQYAIFFCKKGGKVYRYCHYMFIPWIFFTLTDRTALIEFVRVRWVDGGNRQGYFFIIFTKL